MAEVFPRDLLLRFGARTLLRYGTPTHRKRPADKGGEAFQESFTRADATPCATYFDRAGLLRTAAANKLRLHWIDTNGDGVVDFPTFLLEATGDMTNRVLWNRDLTNAAWTKVTATPAKDQVGIDGVANSASSLLATAANATCLQAIVLTNRALFQTAYVKRLVGAGVVQMTMDGGATWTAIALTAAWTRFSIPTQTIANPSVGFRLVANGDKIAVDFVQNEGGSTATSPLATTVAAVSRQADLVTLPLSFGPQPLTIYTKFVETGNQVIGIGQPRIYRLGQDNNNAPELYLTNNGGYSARWDNGVSGLQASLVALAPALGDVVETSHTLDATGLIQLTESVNGGAPVVGAASGAAPLTPAFIAGALVYVGRASQIALHDLIIKRGVHTLAEMQAIP